MPELTEREEIDRREISADGTVQVRTVRITMRDGVDSAREIINRQVYHPGDDTSGADVSVRRITAIEHTPEAVGRHRAKVAQQAAAQIERDRLSQPAP